MSSAKSRLAAIKLPSQPTRKTYEGVIAHEGSPERLLGHKHRPKSRIHQENGVPGSPRVNIMSVEHAEGVVGSQEQGEVEANRGREAEEDEGQEEAVEAGRSLDNGHSRESRRRRSDRQSARDTFNRDSESPKKINPLVDQHRAEVARRVSTGKLTRLSARTLKHPYAFPAVRSTSGQRKLASERFARPAQNDLDESPPRLRPRRPRDASLFSPTRKQRKMQAQSEQEQIDHQLLVESGNVIDVGRTQPSPKRRMEDGSGEAEVLGSRKAAKRAVQAEQGMTSDLEGSTAPTPRRRGRPRKLRPEAETPQLDQSRVGKAPTSNVPFATIDNGEADEESPAQVTPEASQDQASARVQRSTDHGVNLLEGRASHNSHPQTGEIASGSKQRIPSRRPGIVDPTSIFLPEDSEDPESDGPDGQSVNGGANEVERRCNAKGQAMLATVKAKEAEERQTTNDLADNEGDQNLSSTERQVDADDRVYGQWYALQGIFKQRKKQARAVRAESISMERLVSEIVGDCESAIHKLSANKAAGKINEDPVQAFIDISEHVQVLYTSTANVAPNFDNAGRAKSIYAHLFPKLIEVIQWMVECYETVDTRDTERHQISCGHLSTIAGMIEVVLGLYGDQKGGAKQYRARPADAIPLIRPVEKMCASLKGVRKAFTRTLNQYARLQAADEQTQWRVRGETVDRAQEERETMEKDARRKIYDRWVKLHIVRRSVEPLYLRDSRWKINHHLAFPQEESEEDADGFLMERVAMLKPRVGPPFAKISAARDIVWSVEESAALLDGLEMYCGPVVLEKVMARYCGSIDGETQVLNKYNVTEIVTKAADMKQYLVSFQSRDGGIVEDWVKTIPEWVRLLPPPGQENESPEVDDMDL